MDRRPEYRDQGDDRRGQAEPAEQCQRNHAERHKAQRIDREDGVIVQPDIAAEGEQQPDEGQRDRDQHPEASRPGAYGAKRAYQLQVDNIRTGAGEAVNL